MTATTGYTSRAVDELPTKWDGFGKLVRIGMDITAFGAPGPRAHGQGRPADAADSGQRRLRALIIGGTPDQAYEPEQWSSEPD